MAFVVRWMIGRLFFPTMLSRDPSLSHTFLIVWYATLSVARSSKSTPPRIRPSKEEKRDGYIRMLSVPHAYEPTKETYWPLILLYTFTTKCPDDALIQTWPTWTCRTDLRCHPTSGRSLYRFQFFLSRLMEMEFCEIPLDFYAHCFFTLIPSSMLCLYSLFSVLFPLCSCCCCCWMSFCFLSPSLTPLWLFHWWD